MHLFPANRAGDDLHRPAVSVRHAPTVMRRIPLSPVGNVEADRAAGNGQSRVTSHRGTAGIRAPAFPVGLVSSNRSSARTHGPNRTGTGRLNPSFGRETE